MLARRNFLQSVGAVGTALAWPSRASEPGLRPSILEQAEAGLRLVASQRGILYGAAVSTPELREQDFAAAFARECAILVPEYEMKRGALETSRGNIDFSACDMLVDFARAHAMAIRGHTLVWHKRNPPWLDAAVPGSREESLLTGYIGSVAGHFRGRVHSWDVVNEAIAPEDGRKDGMRDTIWLRAFGPHFIDLAYHAARAADPASLLVYNDWGCELGAPANDRFRAATLDFLEQALARGVPIDALGLQGHMRAFGTPVNQPKLRAFLAQVKAMGLRILVTEHDVDDSGGPLDIVLRDRAVADASRSFLDVVLDCGALAVLTWGLSDRFLDMPGWRARLAGYEPRMLPLDKGLRPTPMWHGIAGALART